MRLVFKSFLAATLVVAFAASADAQGQRRGGAGGQPPGGRGQGGGFGVGGAGVTQLVTNKSVQEELKVTDEQKEKLTKWSAEASAKQREKMQELFQGGGGDRPDPAKMQEAMAKMSAEQMEEVGKVLKDDQTKRLKQVMLQIQGVNAFATKPVQEGLKLTDDQKSTITEIIGAMRAEQREMFQGGGGGGRGDPAVQAENAKKRTEMAKKYMEKVSAQLKDDQKKSWEEMTGKPFDYKPEAPRRRDN
jgi:Spy/CpxP family protein refolding chaperone